MKKLKALVILLSLTTIFSLNLFSQRHFQSRDRDGGGHQHGRDVGVPLDGGLLAVLGAAGVAYFVARKKKKE